MNRYTETCSANDLTDDELLAELLPVSAAEWMANELIQLRADASKLREEVARLNKKVMTLREDKKLLDWLADPSNEIGSVQLPAKCVEDNLHSLRDAIRQAMQSFS
jgi:anaerobic glycerol-3-phosphate dehydrogenase